MIEKRIMEITNNFLLTATELAFIEEAENTRAFLADFYDLLKYVTGEELTVSLFVEIEIVKKYINVLKTRYNNRFSVNLKNEEDYKYIFIKRSSILDYFDQKLSNIAEDLQGIVTYFFEFEIDESCYLTLIQKIGEIPDIFKNVIEIIHKKSS
jgi:hypothetical protein